jgi:hypothetical protein
MKSRNIFKTFGISRGFDNLFTPNEYISVTVKMPQVLTEISETNTSLSDNSYIGSTESGQINPSTIVEMADRHRSNRNVTIRPSEQQANTVPDHDASNDMNDNTDDVINNDPANDQSAMAGPERL